MTYDPHENTEDMHPRSRPTVDLVRKPLVGRSKGQTLRRVLRIIHPTHVDF